MKNYVFIYNLELSDNYSPNKHTKFHINWIIYYIISRHFLVYFELQNKKTPKI